ncbi:MAG: adenosine deaminase [Chloroflexi bacterium]|nr:adenosine deaminase [Chloroflexota bacterium]
MSLSSYVQAAPKAELHVHLEGAVQPETLLTLAQRNGVQLPANTVEEMRHWIQFRDFDHFIDVFRAACRCMRTAADYELVTVELGANLARQGVLYAEVTFSESVHHMMGVPRREYFDGLARGRARALAEHGIELAWIFNIVRQWKDGNQVVPLADETLAASIEGREIGVVALGLAGAEAGAPPEPFAPWFDKARAAGLHSAPHAGEHDGPSSVWGALRALGAERIGHGVRAIEDPSLVSHLATTGTPLDVCPLSNVRLGVAASLERHPLPTLLKAGVVLTVNSDDPSLFNTSLSDDYAALIEPMGLGVEQIDELILNGFRSTFVPEPRKAAMVAAAQQELAALKAAHLRS